MEVQAKRQLLDELDKSLLAHCTALGQKDGGPSVVDAYELQALAELHYYLKVEHEFTTAEVEALLSFADPLAVAQNCWEENSHKHSFPICEILNDVRAYERYPLKGPDRSELGLADKVKAVMAQEFSEYHETVLCMSKEDIISKSAEITAMREALNFMQHDYKFEPSDAAVFLHMEKPLRFVASLWPTDAVAFDFSSLLYDELETAKSCQQESKAVPQEPAQPGKPSLRGQLYAAIREINQRPSQEDKAHGGDVR